MGDVQESNMKLLLVGAACFGAIGTTIADRAKADHLDDSLGIDGCGCGCCLPGHHVVDDGSKGLAGCVKRAAGSTGRFLQFTYGFEVRYCRLAD